MTARELITQIFRTCRIEGTHMYDEVKIAVLVESFSAAARAEALEQAATVTIPYEDTNGLFLRGHMPTVWADKIRSLSPDPNFLERERLKGYAAGLEARTFDGYERILKATRELGAHSSWDVPHWNLHVKKEYAEELFNAVYALDIESALPTAQNTEEPLK